MIFFFFFLPKLNVYVECYIYRVAMRHGEWGNHGNPWLDQQHQHALTMNVKDASTNAELSRFLWKGMIQSIAPITIDVFVIDDQNLGCFFNNVIFSSSTFCLPSSLINNTIFISFLSFHCIFSSQSSPQSCTTLPFNMNFSDIW